MAYRWIALGIILMCLSAWWIITAPREMLTHAIITAAATVASAIVIAVTVSLG